MSVSLIRVAQHTPGQYTVYEGAGVAGSHDNRDSATGHASKLDPTFRRELVKTVNPASGELESLGGDESPTLAGRNRKGRDA